MYGGMYPEHILDDEGKKVANLESIPKNKECTTRLNMTSIGGWSLMEFGDVSKGMVKHRGMID